MTESFHLWSLAHTGTLKAHGLKKKNELGTNGGNSSHFNAQPGDEGIENQLKDPKWHLLAFLS